MQQERSGSNYYLQKTIQTSFNTTNLFIIFFTGVEIKVPRQHLINPDAIQIYKELGTGEFGVVQQGVWIDEDQETHQVAIKSLSKERMQNSTMEFMKEYEIMQTIQHENIVRYYHNLFVKLKQQFFFPEIIII